MAGTFILTLPIPIVVNSFANYYKNRLWRNEVAVKKEIRRKELKEQLKADEDNAFEDAERVDDILNVMDMDLINNVDDVTAPPSGASLVSRSSTFPV